MSIAKPYHRIYRDHIKDTNSGYSNWAFIVDRDYAKSPHNYTQPFLLIQEDMLNLFQYIEPADINLNTFSFRIHSLLMRICIEIEANCKAVLNENIYTPEFKGGDRKGEARPDDLWNLNDYRKINHSHHLHGYSAVFPFWRGEKNRYTPFANWKTNGPLEWYQAYNESKHDRNNKFELATFENLLNAFCALFILLSAQFRTQSFAPGNTVLSISVDSYFEGSFGMGGYLKIIFPDDWTDEEKYQFDWAELKNEEIRFQKFDYNII